MVNTKETDTVLHHLLHDTRDYEYMVHLAKEYRNVDEFSFAIEDTLMADIHAVKNPKARDLAFLALDRVNCDTIAKVFLKEAGIEIPRRKRRKRRR